MSRKRVCVTQSNTRPLPKICSIYKKRTIVFYRVKKTRYFLTISCFTFFFSRMLERWAPLQTPGLYNILVMLFIFAKYIPVWISRFHWGLTFVFWNHCDLMYISFSWSERNKKPNRPNRFMNDFFWFIYFIYLIKIIVHRIIYKTNFSLKS